MYVCMLTFIRFFIVYLVIFLLGRFLSYLLFQSIIFVEVGILWPSFSLRSDRNFCAIIG